MLNAGRGEFTRWNADPASYLGQSWIGCGLATGDVDRDGRLDLVFANINDPAALLYGRDGDAKSDGAGNSLNVRLIGRSTSRDPLGARAALETTAGTQYRFLSGGGSYLSTSELRLSWRIPNGADVKGLTVFWPGGKSREYSLAELGLNSASSNARITLVAPEQ